MWGIELAKEMQRKRKLIEFCDEKELCVANTWFEKKEQRKVAYSFGVNEVGFLLVGKKNKKT